MQSMRCMPPLPCWGPWFAFGCCEAVVPLGLGYSYRFPWFSHGWREHFTADLLTRSLSNLEISHNLGSKTSKNTSQERPLDVEGMLLGAWVVIELRVLALNHGLRLPSFPPEVAAQTARSFESELESAQGLLSPRSPMAS